MTIDKIYGMCAFRITIGITILAILQIGGAGAATLTVNASDGADYSRIQDAINNASNGDTILVTGGATTTLTYYENVNINKPVNIIGAGANNTTIQASNPNAHVLFISASNVNISGFTIKEATGIGYAGVQMQSVTGVTISNSTISNNYIGINLKSASSNKILNNSISSNSQGILFESSSNNNIIIGNTVSNATFVGPYTGSGISTGDQSSSGTLIENNTVYSNTGSGIVGYAGSNDMRITGNTAYNNGLGIVIGWSSGVVIENNTAYNNSGDGISIDTAPNNIIRNNNIFGNTAGIGLWGLGMSGNLIHNNIISSNQYVGIHVETGVRDNTIRNNTVSQNQYGILIDMSTSYPNYGNTIYQNNIIGNMHHAVDNSSPANYWNSNYPSGGNYWSDYTGKDANNDGIGETPYNIGGGAGAQDSYPFMEPNGWQKSLRETLITTNSSSFVTNRTAIITWRTNNLADSFVKYGITPGNYTYNVHFNESVSFHNVTLTNLSPDTNYYFVVNSTDATSSIQSQERSFWTPYDNFRGNPNLTNIEIQQLTDYEELASSPVLVEDKIFYASNRTGNMDVWIMDKDGSNKTQITNSPSDEYPSDGLVYWVSWENNLKIYKIIYVSKINGTSNIWIIDGDGTNRTQLTNDSYENLNPVLVSVPIPVIYGMRPSGTIDNNVPVINADYYSYYGNISKVNFSVDGFDVTSFANISASNLSYIPTNPLGMGWHNFTVNVETDKYTKAFRGQSFDIKYVYDPKPSCVVNNTPKISANISVGYGNVSSVNISLDGTNITSNATIFPSYIEYIPLVALSNGSHSVSIEVKSTMGFSDIENWTFSVNTGGCSGGGGGGGGGGGRDSLKIMFSSNRSGNFDLWIMNLDGSGLQQITNDPSNESSPAGVEYKVAVSSDRYTNKVAYVSDKSVSKDIWSMDVNGSNKKQLTNSVLNENMPSSSYVGGIIYTAGKDGISNLEAMNTDGIGKIRMTNSSTSLIEPAHSSLYTPWNKGILYNSATKKESGIYLMNFKESGPKVEFWNLYEDYSLQVEAVSIDIDPIQAWLSLQKNGIKKAEGIGQVGKPFSIVDTGKVVLTGILNKITSSDYYFEVELVNVTQYSSIDGNPLFTNTTKILINKIMLNELIINTTPVHNINKGTNYTTIQSAIDDASPGDEIYVDSGTYYENVNVTKRLSLRGIGRPVVDARGSGSAITLSANGITLEGFTAIRADANNGAVSGIAGIRVNSNNNTLSGNNVSSNFGCGIYLSSSSDSKIYNNNFNNINNFYIYNSNINTLNTTRQSGTNVIAGPYLGGNFWANPDGTGFSQTCEDSDGDGICDSPYTLDNNNIDYLPLSMNFTTPPVGIRGDINRNNRLDTGDATLILRNIVGLPIPSQYMPILPIGDMNCNNRIDTGDATLVLRDVVGLSIPRCWE